MASYITEESNQVLFEKWTKLHQQHIDEMTEVCGQVCSRVKPKE